MGRKKMFLELFLSTLKISAFTFGGGFVIVPALKKRFADELGWIDEREALDLTSVAQSSPGPIAINASLAIGYRVGGIFGALVAVTGSILPPLVVVSIVSFFYRQFCDNAYVAAATRGTRAGVAAVLCNASLDLGKSVFKTQGAPSLLVIPVVFSAVYFFKVSVLWIVLVCAVVGIAAGLVRKFRAKKAKNTDKERDGKENGE